MAHYKVTITNIEWDASDDDASQLPKVLRMPLGSWEITDAQEIASEFISNCTGYCHKGFTFTVEECPPKAVTVVASQISKVSAIFSEDKAVCPHCNTADDTRQCAPLGYRCYCGRCRKTFYPDYHWVASQRKLVDLKHKKEHTMCVDACLVCGNTAKGELKRGWTMALYCCEEHERKHVSDIHGSMPNTGPSPRPMWVPSHISREISERWEGTGNQ